jgi:hypothetical protein
MDYEETVCGTVMVPCGQGSQRIVRATPTEVRDATNAVPQATQRNRGPEYDWDNAELLRVKR